MGNKTNTNKTESNLMMQNELSTNCNNMGTNTNSYSNVKGNENVKYSPSKMSKINSILSLFTSKIKSKDLYTHKYLAFGDDDYGCCSHFKNCNKRKVFFGFFQCFAYDEAEEKYFSWGLNNYGQLAQGNFVNYLSKNTSEYHFHDTLGEVKSFFYIDLKGIKQTLKIEKMSFGDGFSIACDERNVVYSWGVCEDFQLGFELKYSEADIVNGKKCKLTPTQIFKSESKIIGLTCGRDYTFLLTKEKQVYAWGNNEDQQIIPFKTFTQQNKPKIYHYSKCTLIETLTDLEISDIQAGWSHTIAICRKRSQATELGETLSINESRVLLWGKIEKCLDLDDFKVVDIHDENPKTISTGFSHSIIVTHQNKVFAIGDNTYVN